ncbi:hypothetical protein BH10ACT11_BH10ACT11_02860 [soil metagenome]
MIARARTTIAALALVLIVGASTASAAGGPAKVANGRYAGGSNHAQIFFDVGDRNVGNMRVFTPSLESCVGFGGPYIFDADAADSKGRFRLKYVFDAENTIIVGGRFTSARKADGTITWKTTDVDCPGTYKFKYRAQRFAGPLH